MKYLFILIISLLFGCSNEVNNVQEENTAMLIHQTFIGTLPAAPGSGQSSFAMFSQDANFRTQATKPTATTDIFLVGANSKLLVKKIKLESSGCYGLRNELGGAGNRVRLYSNASVLELDFSNVSFGEWMDVNVLIDSKPNEFSITAATPGVQNTYFGGDTRNLQDLYYSSTFAITVWLEVEAAK